MKNEKAKSISEDKKLDEMELQSMLEAYGNDVLRLCTLYLKDRHLAEDALQKHLLRCGRNIIHIWDRLTKKHGL